MGFYRVVYTVMNKESASPHFNHDTYILSNPYDVSEMSLSYLASSRTSTRTMIFKNLINPFKTYKETDVLIISIYSDILEEMFKCKDFSFKSGDMIDFNNL